MVLLLILSHKLQAYLAQNHNLLYIYGVSTDIYMHAYVLYYSFNYRLSDQAHARLYCFAKYAARDHDHKKN